MDMKKMIKINLALLVATSFAVTKGDIEVVSDEGLSCTFEVLGKGLPGTFTYSASEGSDESLGIHFEYSDYRGGTYQIPLKAACRYEQDNHERSDTLRSFDYEVVFPIYVGADPKTVNGYPRYHVFPKNNEVFPLDIVTEGAGYIGEKSSVVKLRVVKRYFNESTNIIKQIIKHDEDSNFND